MKADIRRYLSELPPFRKKRIRQILDAFICAGLDVSQSMKYKMPTLEKGANWTAVGNQKNYVSVYFCSEEMIANIKKKHPGLSTGKGCVRIKDNQDLPVGDLVESFKKAMSYKKKTNKKL